MSDSDFDSISDVSSFGSMRDLFTKPQEKKTPADSTSKKKPKSKKSKKKLEGGDGSPVSTKAKKKKKKVKKSAGDGSSDGEALSSGARAVPTEPGADMVGATERHATSSEEKHDARVSMGAGVKLERKDSLKKKQSLTAQARTEGAQQSGRGGAEKAGMRSMSEPSAAQLQGRHGRAVAEEAIRNAWQEPADSKPTGASAPSPSLAAQTAKAAAQAAIAAAATATAVADKAAAAVADAAAEKSKVEEALARSEAARVAVARAEAARAEAARAAAARAAAERAEAERVEAARAEAAKAEAARAAAAAGAEAARAAAERVEAARAEAAKAEAEAGERPSSFLLGRNRKVSPQPKPLSPNPAAVSGEPEGTSSPPRSVITSGVGERRRIALANRSAKQAREGVCSAVDSGPSSASNDGVKDSGEARLPESTSGPANSQLSEQISPVHTIPPVVTPQPPKASASPAPIEVMPAPTLALAPRGKRSTLVGGLALGAMAGSGTGTEGAKVVPQAPEKTDSASSSGDRTPPASVGLEEAEPGPDVKSPYPSGMAPTAEPAPRAINRASSWRGKRAYCARVQASSYLNAVRLVRGAVPKSLCASADSTIHVYRVSDGQQLASLEGHTDRVISLAASNPFLYADKDAKPIMKTLIASGARDELLKIWDLDSGKCLHSIHAHKSPIWAVGIAVRPDGDVIVVTTAGDGSMRAWSGNTGKKLCNFRGHTNKIMTVFILDPLAAKPVVLSGGADKKIRVWDLLTGDHLRMLEGHEDEINAVVAGSFKGISSLIPIREANDALSAASDVATVIVSGSKDHTVRVWDFLSGHLLFELLGHTSVVYGVALFRAPPPPMDSKYSSIVPGSPVILSCSDDATVKLWNLATGKLIRSFKWHSVSVRGIDVATVGLGDGTGGEANFGLVATCGWDKTLQLHELAEAIYSDASCCSVC